MFKFASIAKGCLIAGAESGKPPDDSSRLSHRIGDSVTPTAHQRLRGAGRDRQGVCSLSLSSRAGGRRPEARGGGSGAPPSCRRAGLRAVRWDRGPHSRGRATGASRCCPRALSGTGQRGDDAQSAVARRTPWRPSFSAASARPLRFRAPAARTVESGVQVRTGGTESLLLSARCRRPTTGEGKGL